MRVNICFKSGFKYLQSTGIVGQWKSQNCIQRIKNLQYYITITHTMIPCSFIQKIGYWTIQMRVTQNKSVTTKFDGSRSDVNSMLGD